MNNCAVSPVIFANTAGDVMRICYKVIHSLRCGIVPVPNIMTGQSEYWLGQRSHSAKICGVRIPEVTHRRITIANVRRSGTSKYSFHRPTIGSDDKVIPAQIYPLKSERIEW